MGHLFRADTRDPMRKVTLTHQHTENYPNPSPPELNLPREFRVGRPRVNWARDVLGQVWNEWSWTAGYPPTT
eukprot:9053448-Karenia_brevis.AAC.1